jgi:hypothetical protein
MNYLCLLELFAQVSQDPGVRCWANFLGTHLSIQRNSVAFPGDSEERLAKRLSAVVMVLGL